MRARAYGRAVSIHGHPAVPRRQPWPPITLKAARFSIVDPGIPDGPARKRVRCCWSITRTNAFPAAGFEERSRRPGGNGFPVRRKQRKTGTYNLRPWSCVGHCRGPLVGLG